jgi:hypothetical protein
VGGPGALLGFWGKGREGSPAAHAHVRAQRRRAHVLLEGLAPSQECALELHGQAAVTDCRPRPVGERLPSLSCWLTACEGARRSADFDTVRQIKERLCYCAFDYQQEAKVGAAWWRLLRAIEACLHRGDFESTGAALQGRAAFPLAGSCPVQRLRTKAYGRQRCLSALPARDRRPSPALAPVTWAQLARETTCVNETYTLPDGRTIRVGAERFMAPEALINPRCTPGLPVMLLTLCTPDCVITGLNIACAAASGLHKWLASGGLKGPVPHNAAHAVPNPPLRSLLGLEAPGLPEMVHNVIQARCRPAPLPAAASGGCLLRPPVPLCLPAPSPPPLPLAGTELVAPPPRRSWPGSGLQPACLHCQGSRQGS